MAFPHQQGDKYGMPSAPNLPYPPQNSGGFVNDQTNYTFQPPPPSYDSIYASHGAQIHQQMPPTVPQQFYPGQPPVMYQQQMPMPIPQNNFYGQGMQPMPLPPQQQQQQPQYHQMHHQQQMSTSYNSAPVPAMFDAGARFNKAGGGTVNVPPPPPGYAPNAAQVASMHGQPVALEKQKGSFWTGGKGAGTTFW